MTFTRVKSSGWPDDDWLEEWINCTDPSNSDQLDAIASAYGISRGTFANREYVDTQMDIQRAMVDGYRKSIERQMAACFLPTVPNMPEMPIFKEQDAWSVSWSTWMKPMSLPASAVVIPDIEPEPQYTYAKNILAAVMDDERKETMTELDRDKYGTVCNMGDRYKVADGDYCGEILHLNQDRSRVVITHRADGTEVVRYPDNRDARVGDIIKHRSLEGHYCVEEVNPKTTLKYEGELCPIRIDRGNWSAMSYCKLVRRADEPIAKTKDGEYCHKHNVVHLNGCSRCAIEFDGTKRYVVSVGTWERPKDAAPESAHDRYLRFDAIVRAEVAKEKTFSVVTDGSNGDRFVMWIKAPLVPEQVFPATAKNNDGAWMTWSRSCVDLMRSKVRDAAGKRALAGK